MINSNIPIWRPSKERIEHSNIKQFLSYLEAQEKIILNDYDELYNWSINNTVDFWSYFWDYSQIIGHKGGNYYKHSKQIIDAQFFPEAQLNYAENLLAGLSDNDIAIYFRSEDKIKRNIKQKELLKQVAKVQYQLFKIGVTAGNRVVAVMANTPEIVIAMLATTSLGAIWSSCSPDFGVSAIIERFEQIKPKVLFFSEGYYYNGKYFDCQEKIIPLLEKLPSIKKLCLVPLDVNKPSTEKYRNKKIINWHECINKKTTHPLHFVRRAFNDPLFIMFSSGTTGKPKCIVHSIGGTLIEHKKEHILHCDIKANDKIFYFTTCSWMMWNWQISALASGASLVLYDGSPTMPKKDYLFDYAQSIGVNLFGTSAKYLEMLEKSCIDIKKQYPLKTLKMITVTGSPLLENGYHFVYRNIKEDVHLASISGGTDIIGCFALGCPTQSVYAKEIQVKSLALDVQCYSEKGESITRQKGELVCCNAFPSMPIYFWLDEHKIAYKKSYFERYENVWTHGDYIEITQNNGIIIYGRSDATLNPGGVRIGTAEIYREIQKISEITESVVVGQPYENDERIVLFVVLSGKKILNEALIIKIKNNIRVNCSPRHIPSVIKQVQDIPKTRNGKISEIAVKNAITQTKITNANSLLNPGALEEYKTLFNQGEK